MQQTESTILIANPAGMLPFAERVVAKQEINGCCRRKALFEIDKPIPLENLSSVLDRVRASAMGEAETVTWMDDPLNELVAHILNRCHRPLGARLLNLETLINMVGESHKDEVGDQTLRIRDAYVSLRSDLLPHLLQEEDILFPWIISGNGEGAIEIIEDLRYQHKVIAMKTKTLAASASRLPMSENACEGMQALYTTVKALEADVSDHIYIENNVLYLRVLRESEKE